MDTIQFLKKLENDVRAVSDDMELVERVKRLEDVMRVYDGPDKVVTSAELLKIISERPEEVKYMTKFSKLDKILGGFREQQVVVIAAPTKNGKTTFAMELTKDFSEQNVLWFPFEESAEELIRKFIERKQEVPHFVTPMTIKHRTLTWIEERLIESVVKHNTKIVFIDHLHFIVPFTGDRTDQEIGRVMRELKRIAKQLNVVIFLIAHLKKTNMTLQPSLDDLRDSSFIAQEADTVLMLWRNTKRQDGKIVVSNEVCVSVQANRRTGTTGNVDMVFVDNGLLEKTNAYDEAEKEYEDEY